MAGTRSKVLSQQDVRVSDAPVRVGESTVDSAAEPGQAKAQDNHNHEPELSLDHDGQGNVVMIHIRCRCGEEITISCDYPAAA